MILPFLLSLLFTPLQALPPSPPVEKTIAPLSVQEGELFKLSLPLTLPKDSYHALNIYLQTLIDGRPLPWPYRLEKAFASDGTLFVDGRLLQPGTYLLPFESFWWRGKPYPLPTLTYTALPINAPTFTPNDLVLPFPDKALYISLENQHLQQLINENNLIEGLSILQWQMTSRHSLSIFCLLLALSPLILHALQWARSRRPQQQPVLQKTPQELLQEIKRLQREQKAPWDKVLFILNCEAQTVSLTAYELQQYFSARGNSSLAEASANIEEHSYRPDNFRFFNPTVRLIESGIAREVPVAPVLSTLP